MVLLIDIGNTHTHLGLANGRRVVRRAEIATSNWRLGQADMPAGRFVGNTKLNGAALCSVVPKITPLVQRWVRRVGGSSALELTASSLSGIGVNYPRPQTIGPDRLANAWAAWHHFGAPVVAVDFGTAVTFEVVDRHGDFVGGIIAPGLACLTSYLPQQTALLPSIRVRAVKTAYGRSTREAMTIGVVRGYCGLVRELLGGLKNALKEPRLPVVATGGYARLMARQMPEIDFVKPDLTLEGLRLFWLARGARS